MWVHGWSRLYPDWAVSDGSAWVETGVTMKVETGVEGERWRNGPSGFFRRGRVAGKPVSGTMGAASRDLAT
ncbi:hypothetical protein V6N13_099331 [Hibiscus sabdariffa]